jgi:hypothetical protein
MAYDFKPKIRGSDWNYGGAKWKLSRSKIDLFTECPLCFFIDNRLGVARPKMPSFNLNIAVDTLLKKEFDIHRVGKSAHPLMKQYGVDAIPFQHKDIESWRENFVGIQYVHEGTGMTISGAVDDVWVDPKGKLIIVDYKATSKEGKLETLEDTSWEGQYKRQIEVYQWLFRKKGFEVSDTGYFVYVNGKKDKEAFDGRLEFDITLISHKGEDSWVEKRILEIKECLDSNEPPLPNASCTYCGYRKLAKEVQLPYAKRNKK